MDEFLIGGVVGCFVSFCFAGFGLSKANNEMCAGNPVVVQKEDTVRTYSCTVELKPKEKK